MNKKIVLFAAAAVLVFFGCFFRSRQAQAAGILYEGTWVGYTAPYHLMVSCSTPWEAYNACGATCTDSAAFPVGNYAYSSYTCRVFGGEGSATFSQPDDEGKMVVGGSTICSYYGCGCDCHSTAANNCATDTLYHGCNGVSVNVSPGTSVSVTGKNDCLATGNGGVFGGVSGSVSLYNDGQTCCVAGFHPVASGQCAPDAPCSIDSFACSSDGKTLSWRTSNCSNVSIDHNVGTVSSTGSYSSAVPGTTYTLTADGKTSTASCPATPVPPACGSANGKDFVSAPTSDFCSVGTPSSVSGSGPWNWTCASGGQTANCSAHLRGTCGPAATGYASSATGYSGSFCATGTPDPANPAFPSAGTSTSWICRGSNNASLVDDSTCIASRSAPSCTLVNGACGTANGQTYSSAPSSNLCSRGAASSVASNTNTWDWTCSGSCGGSSASCSANKSTCTPVSGACGTAYNRYFSTAPTTNLCSRGTPSSVVETSAYWNWSCQGSCGGSTVNSCYANKSTCAPVDGDCGSAFGQTYSTAPTSNLCSEGDASDVGESSTTWDWTCSASCGGEPADCWASKGSGATTLTLTVTPNPLSIASPGGNGSYTLTVGKNSGSPVTSATITASCPVGAGITCAFPGRTATVGTTSYVVNFGSGTSASVTYSVYTTASTPNNSNFAGSAAASAIGSCTGTCSASRTLNLQVGNSSVCTAPVNLTPSGIANNTTITLTWKDTSGAYSFDIRLDDGINSPIYDDPRFPNHCYPHYYCENGILASAYCVGGECTLSNIPVVDGHSYTYWIDPKYMPARIYCNGSTNFTVDTTPPPPPPPPPCTPLTFKPETSGFSANPVNPDNVFYAYCDYGAVVDSIGFDNTSGVDCIWSGDPSVGRTGWNGTAAEFQCKAPAAAGSYAFVCGVHAGTPANTCAGQNNLEALVVNPVTIPEADLGNSDKDIVGVNGVLLNVSLPNGSLNARTDALSPDVTKNFKIGDKITFSINLRNQGDAEARLTELVDTVANLKEPDVTGWQAAYYHYGGAKIADLTPAVSGPVYSQTLRFNLSDPRFNIPAGEARSLVFTGQLGVPDSYVGSYPRFQNSFRAYYYRKPGDLTNVFFSTPSFPFFNGNKIPSIIEIP